jgi:hypothetical protein
MVSELVRAASIFMAGEAIEDERQGLELNESRALDRFRPKINARNK